MNKRKLRHKKMIEQRIIGIVFLLISLLVFIWALRAEIPMDSDITPALILIPLGFYCLLTKKCWVN